MTKQIYIAILLSVALVMGVPTQAAAQSNTQQKSAQQQKQEKPKSAGQTGNKQPADTDGQSSAQSQKQSQTEKAKPAETATGASSGVLLKKQQSSETLMNSLIGMTVKNGTGKKAVTIGTINDIVLNKHNKVVGVLVGVGGFLGIAETNYGVAWDALQIDKNKGIVVVDLTRKQLDQATSYMTLDEQKAKHQQQRAKQKVRQQQQKMAPSLDQNTAPSGG